MPKIDLKTIEYIHTQLKRLMKMAYEIYMKIDYKLKGLEFKVLVKADGKTKTIYVDIHMKLVQIHMNIQTELAGIQILINTMD